MINQIELVLILIFFLGSVSGLRCYQCQSREEGCLNHPPPERYLRYCDSYSVCAATYSREEGMDNVNRYCARHDMSMDSGRIGQCEEMDYASTMDGDRERLRKRICTCNDRDGCNGVGDLKGSQIFVYLAFLGTLSFIKYF